MRVLNADCIPIHAGINDESYDLIFTDPPYGITDCRWDKLADWAWLDHCIRIAKPHAPVIITTQQPFTTDVINHARRFFRHEIIWDRVNISGFLNANRMPMRRHENILVFAKGSANYYRDNSTNGKPRRSHGGRVKSECYRQNGWECLAARTETRPPCLSSIIAYSSRSDRLRNPNFKHPTMKPIALCRLLLERYSKPGDSILDPFAGIASIGVACLQLNQLHPNLPPRSYLGIELDKENFAIATKRLHHYTTTPIQTTPPATPPQ